MITTIERIIGAAGPAPAGPAGIEEARGTPGAFAAELATAAAERSLNLSGHALRRLEQRRIDLDPGRLDRLGRAFDQLAAKGGRQSLVMLDQVAYVVHVPSHTIVTAVAPDESREAVFTQIDSVVIA